MRSSCLNPFMNQVYFYRRVTPPEQNREEKSLNPFMNQVYFYARERLRVLVDDHGVLIPL